MFIFDYVFYLRFMRYVARTSARRTGTMNALLAGAFLGFTFLMVLFFVLLGILEWRGTRGK